MVPTVCGLHKPKVSGKGLTLGGEGCGGGLADEGGCGEIGVPLAVGARGGSERIGLGASRAGFCVHAGTVGGSGIGDSGCV